MSPLPLFAGEGSLRPESFEMLDQRLDLLRLQRDRLAERRHLRPPRVGARVTPQALRSPS